MAKFANVDVAFEFLRLGLGIGGMPSPTVKQCPIALVSKVPVSSLRKQTTPADNSAFGQCFIGHLLHRSYLCWRERAIVGFVALEHFSWQPAPEFITPRRFLSIETATGRCLGHVVPIIAMTSGQAVYPMSAARLNAPDFAHDA